jgi:nucleotide-binding universal stress UspA family protein
VQGSPAECNQGMTTATRGEILVGFSNSAASAAALRWAVSEAKRRQCRVRVMHVYDDAEHAEHAEHADARVEQSSQEATHSALHHFGRSMDALGEDAAGVAVTMAHQSGNLVEVLTRASADARLLVMGMPGDCRHRGLDSRLRQRVSCPVMVVPAA